MIKINYYVYEITNLINGKKYIGKRTCRCDIENDMYMGSSKILKEAIRKYGACNFKKDIIFICKDESEAYKKEEEYITLKNAVTDNNYYNLCGGGKGAGSCNNNPRFGKKISEEHKKAISKCHKGRIKTEKEKENIRLSKLGENNPSFGKKFSDDTKRKMSEARKGEKHWNYGKNMSEENKQKLSNYWKGKKTGGDNPMATKIICLNNGEIFNSIAEAGRKYNITTSNITACCKGRKKSAGKINGEKAIWQYYKGE